jgi:hypothetical protein
MDIVLEPNPLHISSRIDWPEINLQAGDAVDKINARDRNTENIFFLVKTISGHNSI